MVVRNSHNEYVVDINLSKFFDRINHDRLIYHLKLCVEDTRVLRLIGMILRNGIMANGVMSIPSEGSVQGSPLSLLLSNVVLDELDKELEKRGLQFCRFADDCNIFVSSLKAAERVVESVKKFIENKLKLKVNEEKSKVTKKELTPRGMHISLEQAMETINKWYRGWATYFKMMQYPAQLKKVEAHIRRRLCARIVRQQRRKRHLYHKLIKLGVNKRMTAKNGLLYNCKTWVLSHTRALEQAYSVDCFTARTGEKIFSDLNLPGWFGT